MRLEIAYPKLYINDQLVGYLKSTPVFFENNKPATTYRGRPKAGRELSESERYNPIFYDESLLCDVEWVAAIPPSKLEELDLPHKKAQQLSDSEKQKNTKLKNRKIKL